MFYTVFYSITIVVIFFIKNVTTFLWNVELCKISIIHKIFYDLTKSTDYFKMGADNSHLKSMYYYANVLDNGIGIPVNKYESTRLLKMAADREHVESMFTYSISAKLGDGMPVNIEQYVYYCKLGADNGESRCLNNYGMILLFGVGVEINKKRSCKIFQKISCLWQNPWNVELCKNAISW